MTEILTQLNFKPRSLPSTKSSLKISAMAKRGRRGPNKGGGRPSATSKDAAKLLPYLKAWRILKDFTGPELAELANLSPAMISQMENLKAGFSPQSLADLAKALEITTAELLRPPPDELLQRINNLAAKMTPAERAVSFEYMQRIHPGDER